MQFKSLFAFLSVAALAGQAVANPVPVAELEERTLGIGLGQLECLLQKLWWIDGCCYNSQQKCEQYQHWKWWNNVCYSPQDYCGKHDGGVWGNNKCYSPQDWCQKDGQHKWDSSCNTCYSNDDYCKKYGQVWDSKQQKCMKYGWNQWGQPDCKNKNNSKDKCCWSSYFNKCYDWNIYGSCWSY